MPSDNHVRWNLMVILFFVVVNMAYTLFWYPLVDHTSVWLIPGDIWGTFRAAQDVGWGYIGGIYSGGTYLVTFPGIAVLLAPIAMISGSLGLSMSFPFTLAHPTSWLILGPMVLLLGAILLIPLDQLASRFGVSSRRRYLLTLVQMVPIWTIATWAGHPEICLALALALWGVMKGFDGDWIACGWLFGLAIAFQPFVLLILAVLLFSRMPVRVVIKTLFRSAIPSTLLLIIPFVQNWPSTSKALITQPTYPSVNHPTPFLRFAPVITSAHWERVPYGTAPSRQGLVRIVGHTEYVHVVEVVGGGPDRLLAILLACLAGWWLRKRSLSLAQMIWWIGIALSLWSGLDSVMTPYYLDPSLIILILLAVRTDILRFIGVTAIVVAISVYSEHFYSPWVWWTPIVVLIALGLGLTHPTASINSDPAGGVSSLVVMEEV